MSGVGKNDERFEFYFDCFVFFYDFCRRIKQRYDSMENTGKIFGISLGPGDPELITLPWRLFFVRGRNPAKGG